MAGGVGAEENQNEQNILAFLLGVYWMVFPLRGATVVITGAASGIGAALALCLAARGANLALADRNAGGLEEVALRARTKGARVSTHVLDVTDHAALQALPESVLAVHGRVNVLVNNAGVALAGNFADVAIEDVEWLFAINFWAPVRLTRAFMGALSRETAAHIVNVSSLFGLIAPPGQAAYCAAKFALRGFSESLRHELEGSTISLTVVHPGGVRTEIANSARIPHGIDLDSARAQAREFNKLLRLAPETAAEQIAQAIERRSRRLLIGQDARMADRLQRMFPQNYWRFLKPRPRPAMKSGSGQEDAHG
jgi:short-subunit dehydrogenase